MGGLTVERWRGRWAVVTGASAGIGRALAEELAAAGVHLVLTARGADSLERLAETLRFDHVVRVETVTADLENPRGPGEILAFTQMKGIAVDLLVNNAGVGSFGEFYRSDLRGQLGIVKVNCLAVVHLTHLFLPGMIERRAGDVLIVASTAGFQAVPFSATYAASKAFDLLFAEGLAEEVGRHGVQVCALCPGPDAADVHASTGTPVAVAPAVEARRVARAGLEALAGGQRSVVSGFAGWLTVPVQRAVTRRGVADPPPRLEPLP